MKTSAEIRQTFLDFFKDRQHTIVPSAPLVPANDPTLLFTNSGMVQFKNIFLGSEKPPHVRAVDVQRCLRAGGKHNDLDSVGYTSRHHTFFEMLGNWSFGDYFKREAIEWAWQLLTGVFGLPPERLLVTVYHTDDEAYDLWHEAIGLPVERVIRIGDKQGSAFTSDNFWQMAETGPCGPCTEIFYDHGPGIPGGPPGSPDEDGDRYIEIWNLVFMQFDRDGEGRLHPLPAPCVDTGMGLERLAAVLQGVHSNYEIDLFRHLIRVAAALTRTTDLENKSLRVIADHIRACAFLIVDGVLPSNEGRGYVLRRIIRRALRHGYMLGMHEPFFHRMVEPLIEEMGQAYPELPAKREFVEQTLRAEEERFGETLEQGMKIFDESVHGLEPRPDFVDTPMPESGWKPEQMPAESTIPGDVVFKLYDTYGFPCDLTVDLARERGLRVDVPGFLARMDEQRERARAASQFDGRASLSAELVKRLEPTRFLGYGAVDADGLKLVGMVRDGTEVAELADGEEAVLVLDATPFYAESGGQVGDTGTLNNADGQFTVNDTVKLAGSFHGHAGRWHGKPLRVGAVMNASVDAARRQAIVLNHSATHLLHAALRSVLGTHVTQKGSLVAADRLRFDFSHPTPVGVDELQRIEDMVNAEIRRNVAAEIRQMAYQEAIDFGAMALFGEKYGDRVRVLKMGDFSTELCGGTHVSRTGDIGLFKIVNETGVAAGIRRVEAVTGTAALDYVRRRERSLDQVAHLLSSGGADVALRLQQLLDRQKKLERELETIKAKTASAAVGDLTGRAVDVDGIKVVAARLDGADAKTLRESVDRFKQKLGDCVVVLAGGGGGKVALVAGVNGSALERIRAGEVVAHVARQIGGKGGGRADMAQGGGEDSPQLAAILDAVPQWVQSRLS